MAGEPNLDDAWFVTVPEAAKRFGISKSHAYRQARRYVDTGGREGLPAVPIGGSLRVPAKVLEAMANVGTDGDAAVA